MRRGRKVAAVVTTVLVVLAVAALAVGLAAGHHRLPVGTRLGLLTPSPLPRAEGFSAKPCPSWPSRAPPLRRRVTSFSPEALELPPG